MTRRHTLFGVMVAAALCCGTVPVAVAGEAPAAESVKVGMYMPIAGNPTGVTYPVARIAAEATVKYLNKTTDRTWELVFCDPKEDPNVAAECARTFAEEGVVATVGGLSTQGNKINEVLEAEGIASVGNFPINSSDFFSSISFPLDGGSVIAYAGSVFQLAKQGAKRLFVARLDVGAAAVIVNIIRAAAESAGMEFVGSVTIPTAAPDMAPYVSAAQDANADSIVMVLALTDATKYLQGAHDVGAKFMFGSGPGDARSGLWVGSAQAAPLPPPRVLAKTPEGKEYLKAMKRYAKGLEGPSPDRYFKQFMYSAWNAIKAVEQVIEFLGPDAEVTAASVLEGFRTIPELDLGVMPPFKPGGPGPVKIFPRIANTYEYLIRNKNGSLVLTQKEPIDVAAKVDFDAALSGG